MSDQEWQQYLATLSPELADALYHALERMNTLLNRERKKAIAEHETLEQQITDQRTQINNLRTIVRDLFDQLAQHRAVNDASNAARPQES